ncbi:MAG: hypothetical protein LBE36_05910 [Flavobacteriaceae bacterium]|jgi:hypothetical protein|nr:hypothetical protein [Flavobacteriaceae bacterium]
MKNILKITIVLLLAFSIKSFAQIDTLNYLKQFELNKANYIGQPLSKLLNDMTQIQPKTIWSNLNFKNRNQTLSSDFKFCEKELSFSNTVILFIEWQTPIPRSDTKYYQDLNHSNFTPAERFFYSSKIVKDIAVYRSR